MKKVFIFSILVFFSIGLSSYAFESYEEFLKSQISDYQDYLDEIDREFADFLKKQWKEYDSDEPEEKYEKPKPKKIPVAEPDKKTEPIKIIPKPQPEPVVEKPTEKPVAVEKPKPSPKKPEPHEAPVVKAPVVEEPAPAEPEEPSPEPSYVPFEEKEGMALSFYGHSLNIPYDNNLKTVAGKPLSSNSISNWWKAIAKTDFQKSLTYMIKFSQSKNLGDWGFIVMLERFSAKLVGNVPEQKMLVWFFLNKAGFNAKLGYTKSDRTKVMLPADTNLYGNTFYTFSGVKYYVVDVFGRKDDGGSLYTYKGKYPEAEKSMTLRKMGYPDLGFSGYQRELKFKYNSSEHQLKAIVNKYSIAFWDNFPQADLSVYTGARTPAWLDKVLLPEMAKILKDKDKKESVNILLRFVQTAFDYKTDDDQFGREKFLFSEETLYYPYSDCEDRSVLFAYLVRNLLGLDIIMLDFPNHIAAAVDLGKETTGAYITYKGKKYTVTDPTYVNAEAGMVMPRYRNVSPVVVEPEI